MGQGGYDPPTSKGPPDLQSGPFSISGTVPYFSPIASLGLLQLSHTHWHVFLSNRIHPPHLHNFRSPIITSLLFYGSGTGFEPVRVAIYLLFGTPGGSRTPDLMVRNHWLFQLSYGRP